MCEWKQKAKAVEAAIDEVRTCFANIVAAAESLDAKLIGEHETALRDIVQEIIHLARGTEGKLSQFYQVCGLLARSSPSDEKW